MSKLIKQVKRRNIIVGGVVESVEVETRLIDSDGVIQSTEVKTELVDHRAVAKRLREKRQDVVDYLIYAAHIYDKKLAHANIQQSVTLTQALDTLFSHYSTEISEYVERGKDSFKNAILNESDTDVLNILNTVANPENGFTIRDSIIYELNK